MPGMRWLLIDFPRLIIPFSSLVHCCTLMCFVYQTSYLILRKFCIRWCQICKCSVSFLSLQQLVVSHSFDRMNNLFSQEIKKTDLPFPTLRLPSNREDLVRQTARYYSVRIYCSKGLWSHLILQECNCYRRYLCRNTKAVRRLSPSLLLL